MCNVRDTEAQRDNVFSRDTLVIRPVSVAGSCTALANDRSPWLQTTPQWSRRLWDRVQLGLLGWLLPELRGEPVSWPLPAPRGASLARGRGLCCQSRHRHVPGSFRLCLCTSLTPCDDVGPPHNPGHSPCFEVTRLATSIVSAAEAPSPCSVTPSRLPRCEWAWGRGRYSAQHTISFKVMFWGYT